MKIKRCQMKRCKKCRKIEEFYPDKFHACKNCIRRCQRRWFRAHPGKYKEYRVRHRETQRIYYLNWYQKNGRNRTKRENDGKKRWSMVHSTERRASAILRKAVYSGKIIKPSHCEKCLRITRVVGHHFNYSKPLEVLWLCGSCHKLIHLQKSA